MLIISPLVTALRLVSNLDIMKDEDRVLKARPKEFLTMLAGFGVVVSSGMTLVVRTFPNFPALRSLIYRTDLLPSLHRERDSCTRCGYPEPRAH